MYQYHQQQHGGAHYGAPAPPAVGQYPPGPSSSPYGGYQQGYSSPPPPAQAYHQQPPQYGAPAYSDPNAPPAAQPYYGGSVSPQPPANPYGGHHQQQHVQPPMHPYQQQQQPQQPQLPYNLGNDPNVFRSYYSNELRQLTFNSKPAINHLTILASQYVGRMAPVVAQCLEEHIRQAHPSIKLPALYLLDSICKNLGPPYTVLFARSIDRIFLSAYRDVDQQTKVKLEELLGTWRNGAQDGGELFRLPPGAPLGSIPPQRLIEDTLFPQLRIPPVQPRQPPQHPYAGDASPVPPSASPPPAAPANGAASNIERAAVLYDLRKLLGIMRDKALANPYNTGNRDQITTLEKLEQLVLNTTLVSAQIQQIRGQLAKMTPPAPPQRIETPPYPYPKIEARDDGSLDDRLAKRVKLSPSTAHRSTPPPAFLPLNSDLASLTSLLNPDILRTASAQANRQSATPPPSLPPAQTTQSSVVNPLLNLDPNLLSSLASATASASSTAAAAAVAQNKALNEQALASYDRHRLHFLVTLQNSDIARYRPGCSALLYEAMPLRCKQCGNRYLDSPLGKERLDKDLDRHLRITKRYSEGIGGQRSIARSWFAMEEEWVLPAAAIQPSTADIKTQEAKKKAVETAELLNKTVPVPVDAATNEEITKCPICKETFKNEYSEEEEDWVWRNAVEVDGKIYHASCKAEQDGQ